MRLKKITLRDEQGYGDLLTSGGLTVEPVVQALEQGSCCQAGPGSATRLPEEGFGTSTMPLSAQCEMLLVQDSQAPATTLDYRSHREEAAAPEGLYNLVS